MDEVILVAEVEFQADRVEDGLAALGVLCGATHSEDPGCIVYAVHRVAGEPTRAMIIEKWESLDALEAHRSTAHIEAFRGFDGFASPSRVLTLEPTNLGEADKGAL